MNHAPRYKNQTGQTLIETLVGIFVLVMGITAALGLATFSLSSSTNIVKQLIGMGLAREGIEAVKNMRDTNWLQDTLVPDGCYNFRTATQNDAPCYKKWLNPSGAGYKIDPGSGNASKFYLLSFDPSQNNLNQADYYWYFKSIGSGAKNGLEYDASGGSDSGFYSGFYYPPNGGTSLGDPDGFGTYYYRKIVLINDDTTPPYSHANLQLLKVKSQVWWTDKKCPQVADFPGVGKCAIELTVYLTNWKNYQ